jgi:hypothetical protein
LKITDDKITKLACKYQPRGRRYFGKKDSKTEDNPAEA